MRSPLPKRLRAVSPRDTGSAANAVSSASVVSPDLARVVSGVSLGRASSSAASSSAASLRSSVTRVAGSFAAVALSLYVTSCAEPKLDGLPEDPGQQVPLPTIGPVNPNPGIEGEDAGPVDSPNTEDGGDDKAYDAGVAEPPNVAPGGDAGLPGPGSSSTTDNTHTGAGTSAPTTSTAASGSSGTQGTSATTDEESDTSDHTSAANSTDPTDTDTSEATAEPDAGGYPVYDAGDTSDPTDGYGDAGDAGADGAVDGGFDAGEEP